MIRAGKIEDIQWSKGFWIIFDIGFSNNSKTCGVLIGNQEPHAYQFSNAVTKVIDEIHKHKQVNLVIEAPLSVAFNRNGNPKGRSIEKSNNKTRYWYFGPGCTVLLATTFFLRKLVDSNPKTKIKLFEGFVSWKKRDDISDHLNDVMMLKKAISSPNPSKYCTQPYALKINDDDALVSAFKVAGMDFGIPPIILGAL